MISNTNSVKIHGTDAVNVLIECQITEGIGIHLVGLADAAIRESLMRTVEALQTVGYRIPGNKIVINIVPADLTKKSSGYGLGMALAIIAASEQETLKDLDKWIVLGQLGYDGSLRYVPGAVHAAKAAMETGKGCIVPYDSLNEVAELFRNEIPLYAARTLTDAVNIINHKEDFKTAWENYLEQPKREEPASDTWAHLQSETAKRALEIAAAGGHNILVIGAPGTMKRTIAKALPEILPPLNREEAMENALIYSAAGKTDMPGKQRPFRAPHYSCSLAALLGGSPADNIMPGEVSLANNGVLCLDEANQMPKALQEALRIPLEDNQVVISRLNTKITYPARFQMVATMNPCPCGHYGEQDRCTCTKSQREQYLAMLSRPIYDHISVQVWVHPQLVPQTGTTPVNREPIEAVAEHVAKAREIQRKRYADTPYETNEQLPSTLLANYVPLNGQASELLEKIITRLDLSANAYTRIIKIARTIADLEGQEDVLPHHLAEAASYRFLDRRESLI